MSGPLRIAMVAACPFPWPRGTPIRIHRMAEAVARRGHDVHVATYHLGEDPGDPPFHVHRIRDVRGYRRTDPGPTMRKLFHLNPLLVRLLRRMHEDLRFDLVHAHHYEGLLVASHALPKTPLIYDAHTLLSGELPTYRLGLPKGLVSALALHLDRHLPRRSDRTIAVSETIRDTLIRLGASPAERLDVIPNGVESQCFRIEPRATDGRTVIFAGNLAPYQGVDLLLEAFARLRARRPDVRLMIVTDSPFDSFEPLARRLGVRDGIGLHRAAFPEQLALLASATVAVNPRPQCDGIPQKLLNYMAAGLPIATFEGSAAPVRHGLTGLVVPDGDTSAMAEAIDRLLKDRELARSVGDAARELALRDFSWARVAEQVEGVYRAALSGGA